MISYPVHYRVARPGRFTRLQLVLRLLAFVVLGIVGISFGTAFVVAFIALPVFAASRLSVRTPARYLDEDGPRIIKGLRWFAAVSAWVGLVAETLPAEEPKENVSIDLARGGRPAPASAVWRVITGLPSALVLAFLGCIGCVVWLWAALSILFTQRIGPHAFAYLVGLQRWSIRLLAYQASLVEEYPPFSFGDTATTALPIVPAAPGGHSLL
jgi:hypothetical protein